MITTDSYFTIRSDAEGVFRDRGSRFLAFAYPVQNQEEIKKNLAELRREHPSARHHCYAWMLGPDKTLYRANDDGEPSGSAGKPILGQIQAAGLTDILIVVVRYFGGTLLGVNGLINAYQQAAAAAIQSAEKEERFVLSEYKIEFSFEDMNQVMKILKDFNARILAQEFETVNSITFRVKKQLAEKLTDRIASLYKTKLTFIQII